MELSKEKINALLNKIKTSSLMGGGEYKEVNQNFSKYFV